MLDKLEPVSTELRSDRRTLVLPGGARGEPFLTTSNELVALRISRQGTLQWIVGGDTGGDESQLAGYFFLSSGTAHDDRLYVVGQKENKLQLLALESETGKLEWSVVLLEFEAGDSALVNPLRRLSGVAPVIVGKRLLCPTAHGKIVAVDVEERKVAWTAAYEATKQPPARFRLPGAGLGAGELALQQGAQWLDNAVHAAGDLAIVTPIDSPQMYCLDTATGEGKWQRERDDRLFVAVRDNVCLLFGPDNVAACNVRDGTPLWDDRRIAYSESGTMISGRGVFDGDRYLLPVGKELIALDWRKGTVAVIAKSESPLGNLSLHEGAILSQGVDWLQKLWLKY
jgi:outer membrane protein assembly factor BamB